MIKKFIKAIKDFNSSLSEDKKKWQAEQNKLYYGGNACENCSLKGCSQSKKNKC